MSSAEDAPSLSRCFLSTCLAKANKETIGRIVPQMPGKRHPFASSEQEKSPITAPQNLRPGGIGYWPLYTCRYPIPPANAFLESTDTQQHANLRNGWRDISRNLHQQSEALHLREVLGGLREQRCEVWAEIAIGKTCGKQLEQRQGTPDAAPSVLVSRSDRAPTVFIIIHPPWIFLGF